LLFNQINNSLTLDILTKHGASMEILSEGEKYVSDFLDNFFNTIEIEMLC